jgi:hypothetical protein
VVKETLDPDSGIFNDSVIFKAEAPKKATRNKFPTGHDGAVSEKSSPKSQREATGTQSGRKKEVSLFGLLVRLLIVIFLSVTFAGILETGAAEFLGGTKTFGVRWVGRMETNLLVGVFILVFLASAVCLTVLVLSKVKLKKAGKAGCRHGWAPG